MSTLITTTAQIGTIKDAGGNATSMTIDSSGVITHAAGFNNYAAANFTAGSTTLNPTLTAIPSWANIITCSFFDLSGGQADVGHRVAVGGSVITTGYEYSSSYYQNGQAVTLNDRSSSGDNGFRFYGFTASNNNFNGTVVYTKVSDHKYVVTGNHYNHQYTNYRVVFDGRISLSGPISGISLLHSANFDAGSVRVIWS